MKTRYIILMAALAACVVAVWLGNSSRHVGVQGEKTMPVAERVTAADNAEIQSEPGLIKQDSRQFGDLLMSQTTLDDFLIELKALLEEDEKAAIDLLGKSDHPLVGQRSVAIGRSLADHLFERHTAIEAIGMLESLLPRLENVFHSAARELLSPFRRQKDSAAELVGFLNDSIHSRLLDEMDYTIGKHLARSAEIDPLEAMGLLEQVQKGEHADRALQGLFHQWIIDDKDAAARVLASLPPNPLIDAPVAEYVARINGNNSHSGEAMQWAERIADPDMRRETMAEVAETWYCDEEHAAAYAQWKASQTDLGLLKQIDETEKQVDVHWDIVERGRPVSKLIAAVHEESDPDVRMQMAEQAAREALSMMQRALDSGDSIELKSAINAYANINTDLRGVFRDLPSIQKVNSDYLENWEP